MAMMIVDYYGDDFFFAKSLHRQNIYIICRWIWIWFRCGGHGIGAFNGIVGAHGMFFYIYIFYILA